MLRALLAALLTLGMPADGVPVTGSVRDAATGALLGGVTVRVVGDAASVARTDSLGWFSIAVRAPGRLRFTRGGYAAAEVPAAPGDSLTVALTAAPQALEAVTVTALRGDAAAPLSQSRRSQGDLEVAYVGQEMPILLARLPSITATSDAGSEAGYSYFRLRGLDQTRVNVTLDGVPLNEPEDQGVYFSNFPDFANSVRSVQVQRGVGTSSYGSASYAGAVNFESVALAAARPGGELQMTAGSYGLRRASLEYHSGLGAHGLAAYARVSGQSTDGYRDHSGNQSGSAFASAGWFGGRHAWKATAFTGSARNDMAYVAAPVDSLRVDRRYNPLGRDERDRFRQHFASLSHTASLGPLVTLATTAYHVRLRGDYDVRAAQDLLDFNLGSDWTGLLSTAHVERGALTVDAGAHASSYRREHWLGVRPEVSARLYTNTGRKEEASAFAKGALVAGPATVVGDVQLRGARFRYEPDANSGVAERSVGWTFLNPKVGATVRVSPRLALYASLGRTGREPTRNDMLAGFDNLDTSNVAFVGPLDRVRPEYVTDAETGATLETRAATLRVNGFWMAFRDEITPVGQLSYIGLPLRKNVDRSVRRGVELDATLRPGGRVEGTVSAAVTHSRIARYTDDASGVTYRDVEPLLSPRLIAAHDLRIAVARPVSLYVGGRYAGRAFLANTGDRRFVLPPASVADVGILAGSARRGVQVIVHNVADARAYSSGYTDGTTSYYYVHAARHLTLTVRGGF